MYYIAITYYGDRSGANIIGVYSSLLAAEAAIGRLAIASDRRGGTGFVRLVECAMDSDLNEAEGDIFNAPK